VGTESTIISQEVYNQVKQEKFIPIITERTPEGETYLPTFIKSRIYIDLSDANLFERGYEDLLRTLTGRPASEKPPLGKPPAYLFESNRPTSPTTFAYRALENALTNDRRNSTGLARDYLDCLIEVLSSFRIDLDSVKEKDERDALMLARLEEWNPRRDEWVSFLRLICRYGADSKLFDAVPLFFESALNVKRELRRHQWNQHLEFIIHEAFLYSIAVFLQEQRFDAVALLLNSHYRDPERTASSQRYGIFYHGETEYLGNLLNHEWSQQENGTKYKYPQQIWLLRRAKEEIISQEMLKEADVILLLRYHLERDPDAMFRLLSWFPITVGSMEDYHWRVQNFPIFQRATSRRFFDQFKVVLGVESKEDFMQRFERTFSQKPQHSWDGLDDYWKQAFNVQNLATSN
jgi:hypothetical protein